MGYGKAAKVVLDLDFAQQTQRIIDGGMDVARLDRVADAEQLEPGGAAALAVALFTDGLPDTVIAVATGGNVDPATFATALERFA